MKRRKLKKQVIYILVLLIVLCVIIGTKLLPKKNDSNEPSDNSPVNNQEKADNPDDNSSETIEKNDSEKESNDQGISENDSEQSEEIGNSDLNNEAIIIENEGNIEIIIPEDMDSDGF